MVKLLESMKKLITIFIIILPILMFGVSWFVGYSLTKPVNQVIVDCPKDFLCKNVEFPSESGTKIKGWFLQGEKDKGAIVLMHGVRANRGELLNRMRFLHQAGFSVLAFDFQAHGESIGKQITFGFLERKDAEASVKFIKQTLHDEKIGVIGISMGGAAFLLAENMPNTDALVLEMVYPTMQKAIENRLNMWVFNGADNFSSLLTLQFPLRLGLSVDKLRPIDRITNYKNPLLLIAGENDKHTTLEESKQLFATANEPKELWIVPKAVHEDLFKVAPTDYQTKILNFFEKNLRTKEA